jgi:hypothetical protein
MSRKALIVGLVALVVAAIPLAAIAMGAPDLTEPITLHVQAQLVDEVTIDVGSPGSSLGDEEVMRGALLDATGSKKIGSFEAVCVETATAPVQGQCLSTARISGVGQITTQGHSLIPFVKFTNAVNGGTGVYRNARGQVRGVSLTPAVLDLVYRLIP